MANVKDAQLELTPDCIKNIDWKLLRKQKRTLLQTIIKLETGDEDDPVTDDLDGILHLIDSIQDYAVDVLGLPEHEVMLLSEE
jgi:hypothetical protein